MPGDPQRIRNLKDTMKPGNFAKAIVEEICRAGVGECCVAAGARNAEMLIALAESDIRTYRFVDERSAGFFAIGRISASGNPVAVVTTSGTAVAELLPAVIEAHYQGLPLGVISADRPARFTGSGAPQVIDQPGIFGGYVGADGDVSCVDAVADFSTVIPEGAPWHLNVRFEEPGVDAEATGGDYGTRDVCPSHAVGDFGVEGGSCCPDWRSTSRKTRGNCAIRGCVRMSSLGRSSIGAPRTLHGRCVAVSGRYKTAVLPESCGWGECRVVDFGATSKIAPR